MLELFQTLFEGKNFSESEVRRYASDFSSVALLAMLGSMGARLNESDKADLAHALEMNDYEGALEVIRRKMTPEEYLNLVREQVGPLYRSYVEEVIGVSDKPF